MDLRPHKTAKLKKRDQKISTKVIELKFEEEKPEFITNAIEVIPTNVKELSLLNFKDL